MKPLTTKISKEHTEIDACDWIDVHTYTKQKEILKNPVHAALAKFVEKVSIEKDKKIYLTQVVCANGFRPVTSIF